MAEFDLEHGGGLVVFLVVGYVHGCCYIGGIEVFFSWVLLSFFDYWGGCGGFLA